MSKESPEAEDLPGSVVCRIGVEEVEDVEGGKRGEGWIEPGMAAPADNVFDVGAYLMLGRYLPDWW